MSWNGYGMSNYENPRLVLPDPLWIVADDTLPETAWGVRSEPLIHLALGMGLVEELRASKSPISNWQLGQLLGLNMESFNFQPRYFTYGDIVRDRSVVMR